MSIMSVPTVIGAIARELEVDATLNGLIDLGPDRIVVRRPAGCTGPEWSALVATLNGVAVRHGLLAP